MSNLSKNTQQEIYAALEGKKSGVFVINEKLVSFEVESLDTNIDDMGVNNLAQEIEDYPELKTSLNRFLNNPSMKRYSATELKAIRHEQRK